MVWRLVLSQLLAPKGVWRGSAAVPSRFTGGVPWESIWADFAPREFVAIGPTTQDSIFLNFGCPKKYTERV